MLKIKFSVYSTLWTLANRRGVISKGNTRKWRLMLDLSIAIEYVNPEWCSLSHVSVDDAVSVICLLGQNTLLAKVDTKSAHVHRMICAS